MKHERALKFNEALIEKINYPLDNGIEKILANHNQALSIPSSRFPIQTKFDIEKMREPRLIFCPVHVAFFSISDYGSTTRVAPKRPQYTFYRAHCTYLCSFVDA